MDNIEKNLLISNVLCGPRYGGFGDVMDKRDTLVFLHCYFYTPLYGKLVQYVLYEVFLIS